MATTAAAVRCYPVRVRRRGGGDDPLPLRKLSPPDLFAVATFVTVHDSALRITRGQPNEYASSLGVCRSFCGTCGSPIAYRSERHPGLVDLFAGTLTDPAHLSPSLTCMLMNSSMVRDARQSATLCTGEPRPNADALRPARGAEVRRRAPGAVSATPSEPNCPNKVGAREVSDNGRILPRFAILRARGHPAVRLAGVGHQQGQDSETGVRNDDRVQDPPNSKT